MSPSTVFARTQCSYKNSTSFGDYPVDDTNHPRDVRLGCARTQRPSARPRLRDPSAGVRRRSARPPRDLSGEVRHRAQFAVDARRAPGALNRGGLTWVGGLPPEAEPREAAGLSRLVPAVHSGDGGVRQRPLLGPGDHGTRPRGEAGPTDLREALRQEAQERRGGRGGDHGSGRAADDALRGGQDRGATGQDCMIRASCRQRCSGPARRPATNTRHRSLPWRSSPGGGATAQPRDRERTRAARPEGFFSVHEPLAGSGLVGQGREARGTAAQARTRLTLAQAEVRLRPLGPSCRPIAAQFDFTEALGHPSVADTPLVKPIDFDLVTLGIPIPAWLS